MKRTGDRSERRPARIDPKVLAARQRSMAQRLELALSWNLLASQLRAGLVAAKRAR